LLERLTSFKGPREFFNSQVDVPFG
jgi:hypothetical protein